MRKRLTVALAALSAVALTVTGSAQPQSRLHFLSRHVWHENFEGFGGLSGFELAENGQDFLAITDRMMLIEGKLLRSGSADALAGVEITRHAPLEIPRDLHRKAWLRDSEGLAQLPDGTLYVSLEHIHQVWRYPHAFGAPLALPQHADFRGFPRNAGMEALAVDRHGQIYAVPESVPRKRPNLPLYRLGAGGWQILYYIEASDDFDPVGADFGPDGLFYLLERRFTGIGFRSRLRRFDLNRFDPAGEVLLSTGTRVHDNLEGLSIWRDANGVIRATMLADDNFKFFQTSEIVEYALPSSRKGQTP
ncbi:esterase-like activity of phytase family protein [Thalassobius sp. Cn5-15]|uniref:esterase-like activity of phytase family protein n=1 Tax=Thalassobius sp. Cn5-15 TaxID=2917763 RepID=UPI001EF18BC7|nr:esterase-like activity of phytase family protein [Thalassobius sp. Cn5-15]MCG7494194.1 esterase-like activity of phytase family protein [Thalassobius sp. Cn5-15]